MSTVQDRLARLRERYTDDMVMEPRHVFELVEAVHAATELLDIHRKDQDSAIGLLLEAQADIEKRLGRLEELVGKTTKR